MLARGDEAVRRMGVTGYFNWFYDLFPDEGRWQLCPTETLEENEALNDVLSIMNEALEATYDLEEVDDLISSGWPKRIQPIAAKAVQTLLKRGLYAENVEQAWPGEPAS
jgi:hypothetical protein